MEGAVNDLGAGEAFGFTEVKDEVEELALVGQCAGQGFAQFLGADLGAQDQEGIDRKGLPEFSKPNAVLFGLEDGDCVVSGSRKTEFFPFVPPANVEGGMGPEAWEEEIAHGIIMPGDENVSWFEPLADILKDPGGDPLS